MVDFAAPDNSSHQVQPRFEDLYWAIYSPPLLRANTLESYADEHCPQVLWPNTAWFEEQVVILPPQLPAPTDAHHFRLGQYFEQLILTWLDTHKTFRCLAHGVQVFQDRRTVGEFDFLVDNAGVHEHWEVAVKFYLGVGDTSRPNSWYGANTSDRLDLKINRLIKHQLRLSALPAAKPGLDELGVHVSRVRCITKGRLYYPFSNSFSQVASPLLASCDHQRGWWMSRAAFKSAFSNTKTRFVQLPKAFWLAPIRITDKHSIPPSMPFEALWTSLNQPRTQQAVQVAIIDATGEESSRGFVVDDRWLARTGQIGGEGT